MYEYTATVIKIKDGDSLRLSVDLGFNIKTDIDVRLLGLNCPETRGPEKEMGKVAKAYVESLIPIGTEVIIKTEKDDSFGRWLALVLLKDQPTFSINHKLVSEGYAVAWDGKGKRPSFDKDGVYPKKF